MSDVRTATVPRPAVPYLRIPPDADPYLVGTVCSRCAATFVGARKVCSRCGARGGMGTMALSNEGTLHTYSIVYRSFPGVSVPFVSAVVDLEGGGCLKGNLINVKPDPREITFGMPVEVVFRDAGRRDADGNAYLSYFFQPRTAGGGQAR
ncbi:MAG: Zn-ribbon domain-containing OB-fold protein [Myxococcales bacterium]|nr:Zn-ribbon domain-containing OB-fold protein [Myxococcales bacterium]MDD9967238.1 Zn-ribbon domain-containing OB-fold protein [Myxococcales bacterium]